MNRIPPVDEFFMEYLGVDCDFMESMRNQLDKCSGFDFGTITDTMLEFTKLHVEAALKEASEKAYAQGIGSSLTTKDSCFKWTFAGSIGDIEINKASILNSYPLANIC